MSNATVVGPRGTQITARTMETDGDVQPAIPPAVFQLPARYYLRAEHFGFKNTTPSEVHELLSNTGAAGKRAKRQSVIAREMLWELMILDGRWDEDDYTQSTIENAHPAKPHQWYENIKRDWSLILPRLKFSVGTQGNDTIRSEYAKWADEKLKEVTDRVLTGLDSDEESDVASEVEVETIDAPKGRVPRGSPKGAKREKESKKPVEQNPDDLNFEEDGNADS